MRYRSLDSFTSDYKKLKAEHKTAFRRVVRDNFAPACDAWAAAQAERNALVWPKSLRVDEMRGTAGIMEMTWSFASPDGRATFQLIREGDAWVCVWRRIGDHGVYDAP